MNRIRGATAVVTGATSGIGEACARRLASEGVHLHLTGRRRERLEALAASLKETGVERTIHPFDIRDREAVERFAARIDASPRPPDILVNNAGLARGLSPFHEGEIEDWEEMIDTNVKGLLYASRALLPGMIRRDRGHIVNIGSVAGEWVYPMGNVYNATKFAVRALTEGLNMDLMGTSLRVCEIDPGMVETEFSSVRFRGDEGRAGKVYADTRPLAAEDIADAIAWVLNAPPHMNVTRMTIFPTDQRSPGLVHRRAGP